MKKLMGFFMLMSLQVFGAENVQILCSGHNGEVSINIEEQCLSLRVKKNVLTWGSEYDCGKGPCSISNNTKVIDHTFSTCKINEFGQRLAHEENNYRNGKWFTYSAHAEKCLRPGCIDYKVNLSIIDINYNGFWKLASLSTYKVGTDYYQVNDQYTLPQELSGLTCKKL